MGFHLNGCAMERLTKPLTYAINKKLANGLSAVTLRLAAIASLHLCLQERENTRAM